MAILQLLYRSTTTRQLSALELDRLVSQSCIYNYSLGVTGALLCAGRQVVQLLEGEPAAVVELFDLISDDERHTDLQVLLSERVPERIFPASSLEFRHIAPVALAQFTAALGHLPTDCALHVMVADMLHELLDAHSAVPVGRPGGWPWPPMR